MNEQHAPFLEKGQIVPVFSLPGPDGMPHGSWDYKQREHFILLALTSSSTSLAHEIFKGFQQHYGFFREEDCAILVVTANTVIENLQVQEQLRLSFPLLSDPSGKVIARYTIWDEQARLACPGLVLANRYGALYQQWIVKSEAALPHIDELLKDLQYLNRLCTP
jgi:peroxiredoxin